MKVVSVNVGMPREVLWKGMTVQTAIFKEPTQGPVVLGKLNLAGDRQADLTVHGGEEKAVYAYPGEHYAYWRQELPDVPFSWGMFGENLTTEGIDVNGALVGERWQVGTTVLEVSEPRVPCWRLGVRINDKLFPRRFTEALRPGPYLRIVVEGEVGAGDEIAVVERPDHDLTIRDVFRIYTRDRTEAQRLLAVPRMSESWRRWAADWLHTASGRPTDDAEPGCC